MKKNLLTNLKFIAFGIVVALGMSYASAAWNDPSTGAPGTNIALPIHMGQSQLKDGGLSVNTFTAWQNAHFVQQVFINEMLSAVTGSTLVRFGGADALGTTRTVAVDVSGGFTTTGTIKAVNVAGTSEGKLCATADGTIVRCVAQAVPATCVINSFTSNKYSVKPNAPQLTFSWSTTGCTSASINGVPLSSVNGSGLYNAPTQTTVYTLTATNGTTSPTKSFTITFGTPPVASSNIALYLSDVPYVYSTGTSDGSNYGYSFKRSYYGKVTLAPQYAVTPGTPSPELEVCGDPSPTSAAVCASQNPNPNNNPPPDIEQIQHGDYTVIFNGLCQNSPGMANGSPSLHYRNGDGSVGSLVPSSINISGKVEFIASCL